MSIGLPRADGVTARRAYRRIRRQSGVTGRKAHAIAGVTGLILGFGGRPLTPLGMGQIVESAARDSAQAAVAGKISCNLLFARRPRVWVDEDRTVRDVFLLIS